MNLKERIKLEKNWLQSLGIQKELWYRYKRAAWRQTEKTRKNYCQQNHDMQGDSDAYVNKRNRISELLSVWDMLMADAISKDG